MNTQQRFGGWMAIAIAIPMAGLVVSGFNRMATAQQPDPGSEAARYGEAASPQPEALAPQSDPTNPPLPVVPTVPPAAQVQPSPSQVELPFTDVPPDHWAYEALLFLSTGSR